MGDQLLRKSVVNSSEYDTDARSIHAGTHGVTAAGCSGFDLLCHSTVHVCSLAQPEAGTSHMRPAAWDLFPACVGSGSVTVQPQRRQRSCHRSFCLHVWRPETCVLPAITLALIPTVCTHQDDLSPRPQGGNDH